MRTNAITRSLKTGKLNYFYNFAEHRNGGIGQLFSWSTVMKVRKTSRKLLNQLSFVSFNQLRKDTLRFLTGRHSERVDQFLLVITHELVVGVSKGVLKSFLFKPNSNLPLESEADLVFGRESFHF